MSSGQQPRLIGFTARNELGQSYPDPSAGQLRELLVELTPQNRFLILTSQDRPGGQHYAQVYHQDSAQYDVEYRDGSADQHYAVTARDQAGSVDRLADLLTGWAQQRPGWRDALVWKRLELES